MLVGKFDQNWSFLPLLIKHTGCSHGEPSIFSNASKHCWYSEQLDWRVSWGVLVAFLQINLQFFECPSTRFLTHEYIPFGVSRNQENSRCKSKFPLARWKSTFLSQMMASPCDQVLITTFWNKKISFHVFFCYWTQPWLNLMRAMSVD